MILYAHAKTGIVSVVEGYAQVGSTLQVQGNTTPHNRHIPPADYPRRCGDKWRRVLQRAAPRGSPRICGEKRCRSESSCRYPGSPPRMRGKAGSVVYSVCKERITPAHAGKRHPFPRCRARGQDHPRTCGEKYVLGGYTPAFRGSPPRMQGKGCVRLCVLVRNGITPRACGEKLVQERQTELEMGSPPRVRGKVPAPQKGESVKRITPACAGKSFRG